MQICGVALSVRIGMAAEYISEETDSSDDDSNADTDDDESELIASGTCSSRLTSVEVGEGEEICFFGNGLTWVLTGDGALTLRGTGVMYHYDNDKRDAPWGLFAQ